MKVLLRNPKREVEVKGPVRVHALLARLEALDAIEATSPGTKHDFYFGFLARASARFTPDAEAEREQLRACANCGAATTGEVCAFCRLVERATAVPVALGRKA